MIGRLNHIAIATPDLQAAAQRYRDCLASPAQVASPAGLREQGVTEGLVDTGNSKVELLEPLGEQSTIVKLLEKNPDGGLHHLCFEVPDLVAAIATVKASGIRVLGDPRIGAHGLPVVFLHPKDCGGVLMELEQTAPA